MEGDWAEVANDGRPLVLKRESGHRSGGAGDENRAEKRWEAAAGRAWGLCWAVLSILILLHRPSPLQRERVGDLHPALFKHSTSSHKLGGRVVHLCFLFKYVCPLVATLHGGAFQSVC